MRLLVNYCIPFAVVFASVPLSIGYDDMLLKMILELPQEDNLTINPEVTITECSEVLANRDKYGADVVGKALKRRAIAFRDVGKLDSATADTKDWCKLEPKNPEAQLFSVILLAEAGNLDEATRIANIGQRLESKNARWYAVLADLEQLKGDFDAGLKFANQGLALDKKCTQCILLRGVLYYKKGEHVKCLADLNHYLELRPYDGQLYAEKPFWIRGFALLMLDRPYEALSSFLMARRLYPKSYYATKGLSLTYSSLEKWHLLLRVSLDWTEVNPKDPYAFLMCAKAKAMIGHDKDAIDIVETILARGGNLDPNILARAADVYCSMDKYKEALRYLNDALNMDPECLEANSQKVVLLSACPDLNFRNGKEALKSALKAEGSKDMFHRRYETTMLMALAHAECDDFEKAVEFAKRAIELAGPEAFHLKEFQDKLRLFQNKTPYRFTVRNVAK